MKILFLAANPPGTSRLDLDKEVSTIEDGLQRSKLRDQFQLVSKWAVDSNSLRRALLEENPDIVHFSGHGEGQAGLVLVGQDGKPKPATAEALCGLFEQFPNITCVLLNACYAEVQAKAIVQHIDYVIGMKQAVRDDAAIAFATGFYDGLGYGKSIDVAFALGCNAVQFELASFSSTTQSRKAIPVDLENVEIPVEPLPDYLIPVLLKKETGATGSLTKPTRASGDENSLSEKLRSKDNTIKADALKIYRERVQEFLDDLKLSQIEKFQLAILANILGVSEADANQILQEELEKRQHNAQSIARELEQEKLSVSNALLSSFATVTKPNTQQRKNLVSVVSVVATFIVIIAGITFFLKSLDYSTLENSLKVKDWESADHETALLMLKALDREEDDWIRNKEFNKIPCTNLHKIDSLWRKYSNGRFGFSVQNKIFITDSKEDFYKFAIAVNWKEKDKWPDYHTEILKGIKNNPENYRGTLPTIPGIYWNWQQGRSPELYAKYLFSRIQACK